MSNKWAKFKAENDVYQTSYSPFNVTNFNEGANNILQDWNRIDAGPVKINGVSIQEVIQKDRGLTDLPKSNELFANINQLKDFFKKHLLTHLDADKQDTAVEQLMKFFHQGGLQCPVSSASYWYFSKLEGNSIAPCDARPNKEGVQGQVRELNFVATETGFMAQEILTQNRMAHDMRNEDKAGEFVLPDPGQPYVFKAQATIDVDFSDNAAKPKIEVKSSSLNFGNKEVEALLDKRNFIQVFLDTLKKVFGYDTVENLSKIEFVEPEQVASCGFKA